MTHTNSKKDLSKDFENIILAWSSGISGNQRNELAPEAKELVSMLVSSSTRVLTQALKELKEEVIGEDDIYPKYEDGEIANGSPEFHRVQLRNQLRTEQRKAIDNKIKELEEL